MKPLLLVLLLLVAAPVLAQPADRSGPRYDPATVETIEGTVRSVDLQPARYGSHTGVHLTVAVGDETVPVHLGPSWFLDNQDEQVDVGDEIVVVGSRVTLGGAPVVIAREVRRGDAVLVLRDDAGYPAWRGWRHGARGPRGRR